MDKKSIIRSSMAGLLLCGMAAASQAQDIHSAEGGVLVVSYPLHRVPSAEEQAGSPVPLSVETERDRLSGKDMKRNERWNDSSGMNRDGSFAPESTR